ncbi:MAG: universal stress protein [Acidimicrobiales bacterium]
MTYSKAQPRQVLVPLDGSEFSLAAMPTARALAERLNAELHTISVTEDDGTREGAELQAVAAEALGLHAGDARATVVAGADPAEEILRHASALGNCVICLSTHGRGRIIGTLVGSVARSLLQRSPDPIVAVGPTADRPASSPAPRWRTSEQSTSFSVNRLVACVDGSPTSEEALPVAVSWATMLGMSLTIVTVIDDSPPSLRPERDRPGPYATAGGADGYIAKLIEQHHTPGLDVTGKVIRDPIGVASGLRSYLDQQPAGLVALTTHARSGIRRLLLGSTAANIIHGAVVPCLVVPVGAEERDT